MSYSEKIEHQGVITSIDGQNIQVQIVSESACSACHAKGACTAADTAEKYVNVYQDVSGVKVGDVVVISGEKRSGNLAVILGYVIPLILVVVVLMTVFNVTGNELKAGMWGLFSLIPYYAVLSMFNKKLKNRFSFQIKNQSN